MIVGVWTAGRHSPACMLLFSLNSISMNVCQQGPLHELHLPLCKRPGDVVRIISAKENQQSLQEM